MLGNPVSCASRTFPVKVYIHDRELLTDHHLDLNTLQLFVYQGSFRKGAGELDLSNGPVSKASIGLGLGHAWTCAQGRHEAGLRACMGPGSSCNDFGKEVLLAVQYNIFECGGVAIAVCISHKLADGTSVVNFVNAWAGTCRGESEVISPIFDAHIHFPPRDITGFMPNEAYISKEKIVTRRFVFNKSSIAALKREASAAFGPEDRVASRVEVVSAFIWMRFMVMARIRTTKPKQVPAVHAVNLRERMVPQLPVHSFGNLWGVAITAETPVEMEKDYHFLVRQLRNAFLEINAEYSKKLQDGPVGDLDFLGKEDKQFQNFCKFSSWCRFPVYEVDFGMGKPTWVCCSGIPIKNTAVMISTKDGDGIETWVNMNEEDMAMFENDQELLSYAS
uniref:Vinorine synthase n=1 Tax=Quercus lobata TaxID=97700 RepID=A0A7N2LQ64_QUELO